MQSMLEAGTLPVESIVPLAGREGWRPVPRMHKWFARRFTTVLRALLVAAAIPEDASFGEHFSSAENLWCGRTILDPFCGAGTITREARRLGATAIGVDVDPVACAIAEFEAAIPPMATLVEVLDHLKIAVGAKLDPFYRVFVPGEGTCRVLHWFWVQTVECPACGFAYEAHPSYVLGVNRTSGLRWAFCRTCHSVHQISLGDQMLACSVCGTMTIVDVGTERSGRAACPECHRGTLLSEAAGTSGGPKWRVFAAEAIVPRVSRRAPERVFVSAGPEAAALYEGARRCLADLEARSAGIPDDTIPGMMADNRLRLYGYRRWRDLFNARQLLHLALLLEEIESLPEPERGFMALAFSNHLGSNCMLTNYATAWRRLSPLFSVRGWRHVPRPVEINPWLDGIGRGTFPNAVRQVLKAAERERNPTLPIQTGGFIPIARGAGTVHIKCADARSLGFLSDGSVDLVMTDPPYLNIINYSELAGFYRPWMHRLGLVGNDAIAGRSLATADIDAFRIGLAEVFRETLRVLRPHGLLVFTFQHHRAETWGALAGALQEAGFRTLQVFPVPGNSPAGLHQRKRSLRWDVVVVCAPADQRRPIPALADATAAAVHAAGWTARLARHGFGNMDREVFETACRTLAAANRPFADG